MRPPTRLAVLLLALTFLIAAPPVTQAQGQPAPDDNATQLDNAPSVPAEVAPRGYAPYGVDDRGVPLQAPPQPASPWPTSAYCTRMEPGRLALLYDPAQPDRAWGDVAAAHGASLYSPLLARSGAAYRGAALVYALWISHAADADPPVFVTPLERSLDLCNYLHDAWEHGDGEQVARASKSLQALIPRLWCEQLRLRVGAPPGTTNPYLLDLRDAFGPTGAGVASIAYALTRPNLGEDLARSWGEQSRLAATGVLRTMDLAQCGT